MSVKLKCVISCVQACCLAQMVRILKFVLGQKKCVLNVCLCNKVPYINEILYARYFFRICVCLHMLCIKVYKKTSVGETHRDN